MKKIYCNEFWGQYFGHTAVLPWDSNRLNCAMFVEIPEVESYAVAGAIIWKNGDLWSKLYELSSYLLEEYKRATQHIYN